ncbi:MAG: spermidine/putrescine ABC transporter substrate-binding protein [Verrucomicrobiota bacterium]
MKPVAIHPRTGHLVAPLLAAIFSLFLAACGKDQAAQTPAHTTTTDSPDSSPPSIVLLIWDDYIAPEVLEAFTTDTGIAIDYRAFSDTDELVSILKSNPDHYDVIVADDSVVHLLREFKLLRRLDHDRLENLGNLDPDYLNLHFDPDNVYSLPYLWGTTGIGFRADKVPNPEESWDLLWDESLKGKIMMLQERHEAYAAVLKSLGYALNSQDPNELEQASEKLIRQAADLDVQYGDDADVRQALIDGTAWVALCYSGDAFYAAEDNENIDYFIPREGAPLWIDSFVLSRDAPNLEHAYRFLDYMMTPEAAAGNANYLFYGSPNKAAHPYLAEELVNDPRIFVPKDRLAQCDYHRKLSAARETIINNGLRQVFKVIRGEDEDEVAASTPAKSEDNR